MKESKINSLELNNWREYIGDITTNSRWISMFNNNPIYGHFLIPKRENLPKIPAEVKSHHGLWISEIPYQMIQRFTKEDDLVWSIFGGTGIDYDISTFLNRRCIINDLEPKRDFILKEDSSTFKLDERAQLILAHPPYWDIVKYTDDINDGSSKKTLLDFIKWWEKIVKNVTLSLKDDGYMVVACGNIYKNGEEICLGEILKNVCLINGYVLKQHIIKDYGETKGSEAKNYNINYYRQLKNGYGNFYGDNIYILKKTKSKNDINKTYEYLYSIFK